MNVKQLADIITERLCEKEPFAMIRLGDGEGRVLLWPDGIKRGRLGKHLRYWFGHDDFSDEQIDDLRALLCNAIKEADVVGAKTNRKNCFWDAPSEYLESIGRKPDFDANIHRRLWESGYLNYIIRTAEDIVLVTCRSEVVFPFIKEFDKHPALIEVPEEGNTGGRATHHVSEYENIKERIEERVRKGTLCLVGAGILGKGYCVVAAEAGAVALDIGSIFDGWVGINSRTYLNDRFLLRD